MSVSRGGKTTELHGTRVLTQIFLSPKSVTPRRRNRMEKAAVGPLCKTAQVEICLLTVRDQEGSRAPSIHCSACRNSERLIYALTGQVGPSTGLRMLESVPSTRQIACTQYRPASKLHLRGVITDAHSRIYAHPLSYMFFRRISRLC